MNDKLEKYLDEIFLPYGTSPDVEELKEELFVNLQQKMSDLKDQGYDDETAYTMSIDSIGDVEELLSNVSDQQRELHRMEKKDLSKMNLPNSDFKRVVVHQGKFNASNLSGSDFSGADLTDSTFNCGDLRNVIFDGANLTGAVLTKASLKNASFKNAILDNTDFSYSDLTGVCLDNLNLNGTIFKCAHVNGTSFRNAVLRNVSFKHTGSLKTAIFDGAAMDKLTYAVLKSNGANLSNVIMI